MTGFSWMLGTLKVVLLIIISRNASTESFETRFSYLNDKLMNKHQPNKRLIQFILRTQQIALKDALTEKGYAMVMTLIVSIILLSLMAASLTMTNLSKLSTDAHVDNTNTFYAAESGLNKRANQLLEKFIDYKTPSGTVPDPLSGVISAANISNCFSISVNASVSATNDFECRNYPFRYNNNAASLRSVNGDVVLSDRDGNSNAIDYVAHTFVAPKQNYATNPPDQTLIPSGETYAGLSAQDYKYTVYATATKPNKANAIVPDFTAAETAAKQRTVKQVGDDVLIESYDLKQSNADTTNRINAATGSNTNTVLQMDLTSRVVPLFQFAAFYDGDLEISSASNMTISGWVHTNANLYVAPRSTDTNTFTNFLSKITAAGSIYNRIDSGSMVYGAIPRVLMTGTDCSVATNCRNFPPYVSTNQNPLTTGQINDFNGNVKDGVAGITILKAPSPGFLRKRNYFDNTVGEYYAKADMRLEMVPDRDVTSTNSSTSGWNRNKAIIPFNFTSVQTGGTGTCVTTLPVQAPAATTAPPVSIVRDPANNYIDPNRSGASNLHCNVLTKGQLQSLRQPVLVLTDLNQPTAALRTATGSTPAAGSEAQILGRPSLSSLTGLSSTVTSNTTTKNIILRALQVALASTPEPIALDTLSKAFSDTTAYATGTPGQVFKDEFSRLLNAVPTTTLPVADRDLLLANTTTPDRIAALGNTWFLPAPIQRIESNAPVDTAVRNKRSSGFYDGREQRWMTILQTNIASLSVWNRDGLYVNASTPTGTTVTDIDNTLTTAYVSNNAIKNAAFNSGIYAATDTASTKDLVFVAGTPATPKGLQTLGLGSIEGSEGGLVLHATVNDDLNGDGTISNTDDVQADTANPILKKNPDGTNALIGGSTITIDYPRKYRGGNIKQSTFGFAFNGANYLPGAMTLATDQAIYVQGDFNNNGGTPNDRLPASTISDTITVLSNQCLSNSSDVSASNLLSVPKGQLNCGLPRSTTGSIDVPISGTAVPYYGVTAPTTVNAAFLSSTDRSIGNLGVGRGFGSTTPRISGSLNNYMRMLEDWGWGTYSFNYSGSFVSLGAPTEASGEFFNGVYYTVPQRNFNYDTKFNNFSNLPPLSPRAIYLKQDVFKRR